MSSESDDSSDESSSNSSYSTMGSNSDFEEKFKFPPPPRLTKSADLSHLSSWSDSSNSDGFLVSTKKRNKKKKLPSIGFFWDIENCQVPKFKSASAIVQRFRTFFLQNYREAEFIVVCDVKKEHPQVIQELHDSQVNLIHVAAISKNAADEKLRQSLRRFAEVHRPPCAIVLISGDVNFAADLSDLRYRKKVRVILVHNTNAADALILCANDHYHYSELIEDLPRHNKKENRLLPDEFAVLEITNLPLNCNFGRIKARLKILTDNCGGRVQDIFPDGRATIKFTSLDFANRAQKRINGEDVYGSKIRASTPSLRNHTGRKVKNEPLNYSPGYLASNQLDAYHNNGSWRNPQSYPPPPPGFIQQDRNLAAGSWRQADRPISREGAENNFFRPIQGAQGTSLNSDQVFSNPFEAQIAAARNKKPANTDSDFSDDSKPASDNLKSTNDKQPVDLIISNLDASIGASELRRLLANMLKEYAMVYSLKMSTQSDGMICANIRVASQQEAQFAISQLHRQKLGQKRIVISYAQNNVSDPQHLKALIVNILQEAPDKRMALFKLLDLMESRYQCTLSVSEVNKLKDVCKITEEDKCRIISLTQEVKSSPPPNLNKIILAHCTLHCPNGLQSAGWCEINTVQSPNVMMSLKFFANQLYTLVDLHSNSLPFQSFQACYEQTFHSALPVDDRGVSLEHFIMCVPNISIKLVGPSKSIKIIRKETKKSENDEEMFLKGVPPTLASNITLLSRELVDLLRTMEKCQLPLAKFIPAYHHHFGRQCRVADYGFTKLVDLFESMSHVIQIIGDGTRRLITLSHSAQMKRFTSDLLKVLKVQPSKQITMSDFSSAYEKILNKPFSSVDYGLCTFEDLLAELPESTITVTNNDGVITIAVPKREQTPKEIAKTREFSVEVVELLKHSPYCTLIFHKFVPAYHHHFGHQCKVSEYGFTKLIELFEAIPDVVKVVELPDERAVCLTLPKMLQVLGSQILSMFKKINISAIPLEELPMLYLREFGYPFKCQVYECETVEEVLLNLPEYVQVVETVQDSFIVPVEQDPSLFLKVRAWSLLLEPPYCKELSAFKNEYERKFNCQLTIENLNDLKSVVCVSYSNNMNYVSLTVTFVLAAQLYRILFNNNGQVFYNDLESCLLSCYGNQIKLDEYNIQSPIDLVRSFSFLVFLKGNASNKLVCLNKKLLDYQIPLPTPLQEATAIKNEESQDRQWTPSHLTLSQKKIAPPKPDTPPTPGTTLFWNSPSGAKTPNFSVCMPLFQTPRFLNDDLKELVSPGHLVWGNNSLFSNFSAPDAAEVPMPDKLISKGLGIMSDDSIDSGVNTTKLDISPPDMDQAMSSNNNCKSSKNQFPTFFNFN